MLRPPDLKKGDKIGIIAPARKINPDEISFAIQFFKEQGFEIVFADDLFAADHQFAGTDRQRVSHIQKMLDNPDIKALYCARGGYGSARLIDQLDFRFFTTQPKWIIGFSDITVFHSHINRQLSIQTLHAAMALGLEENTPESYYGIDGILNGQSPFYQFSSHSLNRLGYAKGILTGGNLSVLYSLLGSNSFPETRGKILFIEDLDEYLYHIDRMMIGLKRAGVFNGLKGLLVGGMNDMKDNEIPFGKTAEEIIKENVNEFGFPVCFGIPAGHQKNNLPLIMGAEVELDVQDISTLNFIA